jgi:hypothetical protein
MTTKKSATILGIGLFLASSLALAPHASCRDYYVKPSGSDRNDGSQTRPFQTIQRAADLTQPGDNVIVGAGTYRQPCSGCYGVTIRRSGSAAARITYKAYPGERPKVRVDTGWGGFMVEGAAYITIDGFEVEGPAADITYEEAYAARNDGGDARMSVGCVNSKIYSGRIPHHITVRNNHLHHCSGGGVGLRQADYVTVENNRIHSNAWWTPWAGSGISIQIPQNADSQVVSGYRNKVTGNVVWDNLSRIPWLTIGRISDGNGIIIDEFKNTNYQGKTLVANNVSYQNGGSGIHCYVSTNVDIINNTSYQNSLVPETNYGEIFANNCTNVNLRNNVMYARSGKYVTTNYNNINVVYDYNLYFNGTPAVRGPNDIIANPLFVNPAAANFFLQSVSAGFNSGSPVLAPSRDIVGTSRPQGAGFDRGAYESPGAPGCS